MEKKIVKINKALTPLLLICIATSNIVIQGLFSWITGLVLIIIVLALIGDRKKTADEREMYLKFATAHIVFIITFCFLFIYETVKFLETHTTQPIVGYTMAVMGISYALVSTALHRERE